MLFFLAPWVSIFLGFIVHVGWTVRVTAVPAGTSAAHGSAEPAWQWVC